MQIEDKPLFHADELPICIRQHRCPVVYVLSDVDEQHEAGTEAGGWQSEWRLQLDTFVDDLAWNVPLQICNRTEELTCAQVGAKLRALQ